MARINQASLRAQLDDCRAQFEAIKQKGEARRGHRRAVQPKIIS